MDQEEILPTVTAACAFSGITRTEYYTRLKNGDPIWPAVTLPGRAQPLFLKSSIIEWMKGYEGQHQVQAPRGVAKKQKEVGTQKRRGRPSLAELQARGAS